MLYEHLFRVALLLFLADFYLASLSVMAFEDSKLQKFYDRYYEKVKKLAILFMVLGGIAYAIQNA